MRSHLRYLAYVLRHKWHVFVACRGLNVPLWQAIIHRGGLVAANAPKMAPHANTRALVESLLAEARQRGLIP